MFLNKKIKICHIANADITLKFLLFNQLKFLKEKGYDVSAVCSSGKWVKDIEAEGIKVKTIRIKRKISPFSDLITFWQLFWYIKKEKFQIVHTHNPKPGVLGQLAAKLAGVPIIINTIHGFYFTRSSSFLWRNFLIVLKRISAKCSDLIFSQNREDIEVLLKKKIAFLEKIRYLGNGVDVDKFFSRRFQGDFISKKKKELGLDTDFKMIGTVGRLVKEKGYFDLFEAFKIVLKSKPKTFLLIVGPSDLEKSDSFSPSVVKNYGIEKNVFFLGERTDIDELYPLMDIFILASHREGFPKALIEAMAAKRPIIATDIRGCREAIENNETGILVPAKNPEKLAEAMMSLLGNTAKAELLARKAEIKARKEFNENLVFAKIGEEYERLLSFSLSQAKICHVTTVDISVRFIILDFLRSLKKDNCKVFVACFFGKWEQFLKKEGFVLHNVKMTRKITPLRDLFSLIKLFFYFKREKFDIVHTYTPKAGILGRIAAKMAGVPMVIHSSYGFYIGAKITPWTRKAILFAEKIASYFCDLIFSQNKEDIELVIRKKIARPEKIKLIKYGIDIKRFDPLRFSKESILEKKKELGVAGKKIIGMVGRFVKEKGYLELFSAFKIIKNKIPDAVLLLVAPKDKEKSDALDSSILKEYGIEKETILLGYNEEISNMEEIYPLMDVFVLPSWREGLPYSIMEASACGKTVVATDIRGCREAVENGTTGILVPPGDIFKLSETIAYFLNNPDKAAEFGKNGRRKAEQEFNQENVFNKIKTEYKDLIAKKYGNKIG